MIKDIMFGGYFDAYKAGEHQDMVGVVFIDGMAHGVYRGHNGDITDIEYDDFQYILEDVDADAAEYVASSDIFPSAAIAALYDNEEDTITTKDGVVVFKCN